LIDPLGRHLTYLRLSVTDRCDLRCTYCMGDDVEFVSRPEILSLEELGRLARIFVAKGIRKIRLTGGEPLVRRNIMVLIHELGSMVRSGHLDELTLTTNGTQLGPMAPNLAAAGISRINVSLDSLEPDVFARVTRRGELAKVLDGLDAASRAGIHVRINTVVQRGVNEDEIGDIIAWCGNRGFDLGLIELMPLGAVGMGGEAGYLPLDEIRRRLSSRWTLVDCEHRTNGPAVYQRVAENNVRIGFISPMSDCFCGDCNRIRVTSAGILHTCLDESAGTDLRFPLRNSGENGMVGLWIDRAVARKQGGHSFHDAAPPVSSRRSMNMTGG